MAIWFALTVTMPTIVKVFKVTFAAIHCAVIFISDRLFAIGKTSLNGSTVVSVVHHWCQT